MTTPNTTFTKSNGSRFSRIYERLTKRSRRAEKRQDWAEFSRIAEVNYRRGVYDTLRALQADYS